MNIFKAFASAKSGFQEVYASAILAWFLNPTMEHGLGYSFLSGFIGELAHVKHIDALGVLQDKLLLKLRSEHESQLQWSSYLELNVGEAFIDVVLRIEDWIISIENKIFVHSISDADQLVKQYNGLKTKYPEYKVGIIYLVPVEDSALLHPRVDEAFSRLSVIHPDFKAVVTWQKNNLDEVPSVSDMIEFILREESLGNLEPIPEYTRHTLKALNMFIANHFSGYDYEKNTSRGGDNPLTEARYDIKTLGTMHEGFVGVNNGVSGLLRMEKAKLRNSKFQYTRSDMTTKRQWIGIDLFNRIIAWLLCDELPEIEWDLTLPSELLFKITKDYGAKVYIGIKGGENKLMQMSREEIRDKSWGISTNQASSNWILGDRFYQLLLAKGVFASG